MNEQQAKGMVTALGGYAWNSGGGMWLVRLKRADGSIVVISDDVVCEYGGEKEFEASSPRTSILLH